MKKCMCLIAMFAMALCSCNLGHRESEPIAGDVIWQEAEQFESTGKWSNDSQHIDIMGSPYLLATGVGKPVDDAVTTVKIETKGTYTLWVRCRNWLVSHSPGQFKVLVNGKASAVTFGKTGNDKWQWVNGGDFLLEKAGAELRLHDTTGWWSRCDAIVLATKGFIPSDDKKTLAAQRLKYAGVSPEIKDMGAYDLVVVGGGPAGMGAAIAAARNGIKVAFIQDRPVLGGNSSSEIQVPPMGYIGNPPDKKNVTGITAELFGKQVRGGYADSEKMERIVRAEKNISLFLNTRAVDVEMDSKTQIKSVIALDVHSGQRMRFSAPLFADTTGHGWIGFYAGAEWRMGEEAADEFDESLAPTEAGKRTMGNTLYKAVITKRKDPVTFECPEWAYQWKSDSDFEKRGSHKRRTDTIRPENFDRPSRGKGRNPGNDPDGGITRSWWVEYGGMENIIDDAEHIRDELLRINLGLWNYAKNHNPATKEKNEKRELVWLNYVPGVRESRRLVGDYIMNQRDYDDKVVHNDTVAFTDWGPDIHHPEGYWVRGNDCIHTYKGRRTSIPYRTLYSKNIENLFMAGRCHSATHIAHGGTRVMRPMCATGQAAGTAAAIATKYKTSPRGVYQKHIEELQNTLIKDGCRLMNKDGGMRSAAHGDFRVTVIGKKYTPPQGRVAVSGAKAWRGDGGPSIRNTDRKNLLWKEEGYFQRNRDVGQVFLPKQDIRLDALVIRIGPKEDNAVGTGAPGAELFLQFFEVIGEPRINDNGTPQGTDSKHGFSRNHRCDDFIDGITYRSIHIARGGIFPKLLPTMDKNGKPTGDKTAIFQYLRLDLTGKSELVLTGGKRYAFMLGFVEPGPARCFTVGNWNHAKENAPPSLTDKYDTYHDGWALRREGDGTIPPMMTGKRKQPKDAALLKKFVKESMFDPPPARFDLPPATDGYPDVDTYRDLEFYLEVHPHKNRQK